jgi:hypothetical protein
VSAAEDTEGNILKAGRHRQAAAVLRIKDFIRVILFGI